VSPSTITANIAELYRIKRKDGLDVNITVNSVVYKDVLKNDGLEKLNDLLSEIDLAIWHIICPIYPDTYEGSIINDKEATKKLFALVKKLKSAGRNIMMDFPMNTEKKIFNGTTIKCFRRYFRLEMSESGNIYSPCSDAPVSNPVCDRPCNCAGFIDDILIADNPDRLTGSPVKSRFNQKEIDLLHAFVSSNINKTISRECFKGLKSNNGVLL
jgi:hypothetical protein